MVKLCNLSYDLYINKIVVYLLIYILVAYHIKIVWHSAKYCNLMKVFHMIRGRETQRELERDRVIKRETDR